MASNLIYIDLLPVSDSEKSQFQGKVKAIANKYGFNPNWLMAVMYFETGGQFKTGYYTTSGAVGLIQFTDVAAKSIGTTKGFLSNLSHIDQLTYVDRYLSYWKITGRISSFVDLYLVVFAPSFVGRASNTVIYSTPSSAYERNKRAFDKANKGFITVGDVANTIARYLPVNVSSVSEGSNFEVVVLVSLAFIVVYKLSRN